MVSVRRWYEPFHLGELASEQPRRDSDVTEIENRVEIAVAEHDCSLTFTLRSSSEALDLRQRLGRHENLTARFDRAHPREVPKCEPVGISGDQPETAIGCDHQHPGELRSPRVVDERGADDLA